MPDNSMNYYFTFSLNIFLFYTEKPNTWAEDLLDVQAVVFRVFSMFKQQFMAHSCTWHIFAKFLKNFNLTKKKSI